MLVLIHRSWSTILNSTARTHGSENSSRCNGDEPTPEQIFLALGAGNDDDGGTSTSTTYEKLKQSIISNGGIIQPVILNKRQDGTLICVEGNTRVALYQDFQKTKVKGNWTHISALVHDEMDEASVHAIRLQVHLVGPRPWDPYSKAKYLYELRTQEHLPRPIRDIFSVLPDVELELTRFLGFLQSADRVARACRYPSITQPPDEDADAEDYAVDIEDIANQQIVSLIKSEFAGHALADLVAEILRVEEYTTKVSPPGPDGGVDVLATGGTLGLGEDRICVQVKSGDGAANHDVVLRLIGSVSNTQAQTGLLVSIGSVNAAAQREFGRQLLQTAPVANARPAQRGWDACGLWGVHETESTSRSELDRLASPDRADQYLVAQEVPYLTWIRATQRHFRRPPAPIRAPGLCHPTCPNRAHYPVLSDL